MSWVCTICGVEHDGLPDCFGAAAPWPALVPEDEFATRVFLSDDQCVVDDKHFFIRGHVEIPIHGHTNPLAFSVWSSLSEASFMRVEERWVDPEREGDSYFGWLSSPISNLWRHSEFEADGDIAPTGPDASIRRAE